MKRFVMCFLFGVFTFGFSTQATAQGIGVIGDFVWLDENENGLQDEDEPGIPDVPVTLLDFDDGNEVASTTTDADGIYEFAGLDTEDRYQVEFIAPTGFIFTRPEAGPFFIDSDALPTSDPSVGRTREISFPPDVTQDLTVDAGLIAQEMPEFSEVGDFVWKDCDADGIQDSDEAGFSGVTVQLFHCEGTLVAEAETVTDANGFYIFQDLVPGDYFVQFSAPDGFTFTHQDQGDDTLDSDADEDGLTACFTVTEGESNRTIDAGLVHENNPPDCSEAFPSIHEIWPPNHKFVEVEILGVTDPDGDPVTITIQGIFQDEPVDAKGSGRFAPDGAGIGESRAWVRAERAGTENCKRECRKKCRKYLKKKRGKARWRRCWKRCRSDCKTGCGNGRVYHIFFEASDDQGAKCFGEVRVGVPKSQGKKGGPVDEGPLFNSTIPVDYP